MFGQNLGRKPCSGRSTFQMR